MKQDIAFKNDALLPHQIQLTAAFDKYRILVDVAPAKSLVEGCLGATLDLPIEERESLSLQISKIRSEYNKK